MRWKYIVTGAIFLGFAYLFFILSEKKYEREESKTAIQNVLKSQAKSLKLEIKQILETHSKQAKLFASLQIEKKWREAQTILQQSSAIRFVLLPVKPRPLVFHRGKAKEAKVFQKFANTLLKYPAKLQVYWESAKGKGLLVRKYTNNNSSFIAAFDTKKLFSHLNMQGAIHPWIALENGTIIYHTLSYYMGEDANNVKAVALAAKNLRKKLQTEAVSKYINIKGEEVLGAWTIIPQENILLGTEWPGKAWTSASSNPYYWTMIFCIFLGALCFGLSFTPYKLKIKSIPPTLSDIDEKAKNFVSESKEYIERAHLLIEQKEKEWSEREEKSRERLAIAEKTRWILGLTESLLDESMEAPHAEDVWAILSRVIHKLTQSAPNLVFRYSQTSCSLVPQAFSGVANFPESAQRYLKRSRILLGNARHILQLEKSHSFMNWKEKWSQHMPTEKWNFLNIPFAHTSMGVRGSVLLLLTPEQGASSEISNQRELLDSFTYRAAWLYDMKKRLLHLKHARIKIAEHTKDAVRDKPFTT